MIKELEKEEARKDFTETLENGIDKAKPGSEKTRVHFLNITDEELVGRKTTILEKIKNLFK